MRGIIFAGGVGSRLWPMSTNEKPKQFLKLFSSKSLFQLTILRNTFFEKLSIAVNIEHYEIAKQQIDEISVKVEIIVEPYRKGTAPISIIAALHCMHHDEQNFAIIPSDHFIVNEQAYVQTFDKARRHIDRFDMITIGIRPNKFSSEYGYIEAYQYTDDVMQVNRFKEKPCKTHKESFLHNKYCYWNSGIYMINIDKFIQYANSIDPYTISILEQSYSNFKLLGSDIFLDEIFFKKTPENSFDVMFSEKIKNMGMIQSDFDWLDLGSWQTLFLKIITDRNYQNLHSLDI